MTPQEGNISFESTTYGSCRAEFYTEKSYIRHLVDGKWISIIGSTFPQHHKHIKVMVPHVIEGKSTEELKKLRDEVAGK